MATEHSSASRPQPVSEVNVSHRAKQAVDYYKQNVAPRYNHSGNTSKIVDYKEESSFKDMNGVDRANSFDDLRSDCNSVNSNSFHRAKMKHGITDMRSSFSAAQQRSFDFRGNQGYHFDNYQRGETSRNADKYSSGRDHTSHIQKQDSHGMHKSSSNMEIDNVDGIDDDAHNTSLKREYGSTSSLDVLGASTDSFFTMLNDLKTENLDQRSPAPAKLAEFLKGKVDKKGQTIKGHNVELEPEDHNASPKFKSKFKHKDRKSRSKTITGETGILKKLRGKTEDSGSKNSEHSEGDSKFDERLRKKAFTHYDCQSISFDVNDAKENRTHNSLKNISTGASAASASRNSIAANESQNPDVIADIDDGDGRSNDLVLSCPFFRNELGGEEERQIALSHLTAHKRSVMSPQTELSAMSLVRLSTCTGLSILDSSPTPSGQILPPLVTHRGHVTEYVDHGCTYYRHYIMDYDHQNYFGVDENFGPIALSIRREKIFDRDNSGSSKTDYGNFQYRIIFRTSELTALRGSILEDAVQSSSRLSSSRGLPMKDIVDFILPDVQTSCLKPGISDKKTYEQLVKLDETGLTNQYKIGILYCKAGQSSEEEMYNNETAGPAFEEFLDLIGKKVRLKGWETYRAQLDNKTDSTGTHSVYTQFNNCEIMFHVSTMLPFTHNNRQQLLRKRHVGNDIVTLIFQEPGSQPFTAMSIRSHYQHIFIIVRVHEPNTERTRYSISVSRSKDVPSFGPPFAENMTFPKSKEFRDFLLAKLLNGENAAHRSEKFKTMAIRTRQEYLRDLAMNYINTSESGSKLSKFALGSGRRKEKSKQKVTPDLLAKAALIWNVQIEDFGLAAKIDCLLGIAFDTIVVLEKGKDVIFTIPCSSVIGWTLGSSSLRLYFGRGEFILLHTKAPKQEELNEIIHRLLIVTQGCETIELNLKRNGLGQLGFHVQPEGIITDVEGYGFAEQAGVVKNSRLVEICKVARTTMMHEQMLDLLRTSATVCIVVIPPHKDGRPRGGELRSLPTKYIPSFSSTERHFTDRPQHRQPYHAYTDSSASSMKDSVDSHNTPDSTLSRCTGDSNLNRLHNSASNGTFDSSHSREESHDSSDHSSATGLSQSWNVRTELPSQSQGSTTRWHEFAKDLVASYSGYLGSTETVNDMSASTNSFPSRKSVTQADYISFGAPPTGNIALELLKQCQNTKYLLNQKNGSSRTCDDQPSNSTGSSNLSHFSSTSSHSSGTHHSSTYPPSGHRSQENLLMTSSNSKDDLSVTRRKDSASKTRTRPKTISYRNPQLSASPISSPTSSPRSSDRNLSGMSSEESLSSKPRAGSLPASKPLKTKAESITNLQNKLMKLIDPDSIESDHPKYSLGAFSRINKRTVSDESLHSSQRIIPADVNNVGELFSSGNATSKSGLTKEQRLSPRAVADSTLSSSKSKVGSSRTSPALPLPESTAGLEWSNLVNVATKAIEGDQSDQTLHGSRQKEDVLKTGSESASGQKEIHESQITLKSGPTVWRSNATTPHQRIEELEERVATLQEQLKQEREEKNALDEEVQDLRVENIRLQEESQTAAAQLRKFTEWFFSTIDRH